VREQGVEITTMFDLYRSVTGRFPMEDGPAFRLAALTAPRERAFVFYTVMKRSMDIAISLLGLVGVGLLIPFIAAGNRLESPGPLFYSQVRVGKGGRTFRILKFRSMVVNAERPGEAQWARQNDTRITRIGRFLRRTHIDELPQLWNVLTGDMSFVGPRPERPELINELRANIQCYSARHAVRPGLTGWAQINYPYGNTLRDALVKLEYDLYYIQHRGIWLDVLCMLRTARAVVMMTGI
jgi:lipopolysaccharide/colanic/teichoic acid biosynthesis glycosyltransferase